VPPPLFFIKSGTKRRAQGSRVKAEGSSLKAQGFEKPNKKSNLQLHFALSFQP
jgi:hypothetical protein